MNHLNDTISMFLQNETNHTVCCRLTNIRNALVQVQLRVVFVIDSSRQMEYVDLFYWNSFYFPTIVEFIEKKEQIMDCKASGLPLHDQTNAPISPDSNCQCSQCICNVKSLKTNVENPVQWMQCVRIDMYESLICLRSYYMWALLLVHWMLSFSPPLPRGCSSCYGFHFSACLPKCFTVSVDMLNSREWTTVCSLNSTHI